MSRCISAVGLLLALQVCIGKRTTLDNGGFSLDSASKKEDEEYAHCFQHGEEFDCYHADDAVKAINCELSDHGWSCKTTKVLFDFCAADASSINPNDWACFQDHHESSNVHGHHEKACDQEEGGEWHCHHELGLECEAHGGGFECKVDHLHDDCHSVTEWHCDHADSVHDGVDHEHADDEHEDHEHHYSKCEELEGKYQCYETDGDVEVKVDHLDEECHSVTEWHCDHAEDVHDGVDHEHADEEHEDHEHHYSKCEESEGKYQCYETFAQCDLEEDNLYHHCQ